VRCTGAQSGFHTPANLNAPCRLKAAGKRVETFYMADEAHILSMLAVDRVIARLVAFLTKVFATLSL
jgi:hypothetical protein